MIETGTIITVQDNASASAKRISEELQGVARSADNVNSSFDSRVLDEYDKKLTQIGENFSKLQQKQQNVNRMQVQRGHQIQGMTSSAVSTLTQAGRGDVGGATDTAGKGLSGLASLMGGSGALLAGMAVAGVAVAGTNALANQYEPRSGPATKLAGLQGDFGTDMEANTKALREAMASTVESVSKFGITFEEGAKAQEAFLMAGGTDFPGSRAGDYAMAGRGSIGQLSATSGLFQRYGQTGVLDTAEKLRKSQGLEVAQYGELLTGIESAFTSALSRGVIRDPNDIAITQAFMARGGETFQGALGAQKVAGMDQATANAGNLQSQEDIFLYRAGQKLKANKSGGLIETQMLLEQGLSPELLNNLFGEYEAYGYGETEQIKKLQSAFGLSVTDASKIYGMDRANMTQNDLDNYTGVKSGTGQTIETQYTENIENLRQTIAGEMGAVAFDIRAKFVEGGTELLDKFKSWFSELGDSKTAEAIHTRTIVASSIQINENMATDTFGAEVYLPAVNMGKSRAGYSELVTKIDEARADGATEAQLSGITGRYMEYTKKDSVGGVDIAPTELAVLNMMIDAITASNQKVIEAINSPMQVYGRTRGVDLGETP